MSSRFSNTHDTRTGTVLFHDEARSAFLSAGLSGIAGIKFFLNCFWQPMLS